MSCVLECHLNRLSRTWISAVPVSPNQHANTHHSMSHSHTTAGTDHWQVKIRNGRIATVLDLVTPCTVCVEKQHYLVVTFGGTVAKCINQNIYENLVSYIYIYIYIYIHIYIHTYMFIYIPVYIYIYTSIYIYIYIYIYMP